MITPHEIIQSPTEKELNIQRPVDAPGYTPPANPDEDPFPYKLSLLGDVYPLNRGEHESTSGIRFVPLALGTSAGETLLDMTPYASLDEAVTVGNSFPNHPVYEEWRNREQEQFDGAIERQVLPRYGSVVLRNVCLYVPKTSVDALLSRSDTEGYRLDMSPGSLRDAYARYIFAQGTHDQPLMKVMYVPDVMPSDLPPLNYSELTKLANEHFTTEAGMKSALSQAKVLEKIRSSQVQESVPRATRNQLNLAYQLVFAFVRDITGPDASDADRNILELEMLNRIFDGGYIDINAKPE